MIPADHEDRLERLRVRGEVLFQNMKHMKRLPDEYVTDIKKAWEEALKAKGSPDANLDEASYAAIKASRLDSILSLLERIARPSIWLDKLSIWFGMAQCCLHDAAAHAGNDTPIPSPILAVEPIDSPLYVPRARGT